MNDNNKETRNRTELAAENKELREYLRKAVLIIENYQRADAVAEAMAKNNDKLRSVETRTYQTAGEEVEVDEEAAYIAGYKSSIDSANHLLEEYKDMPLTDIVLTVDYDKAHADFAEWKAK